MLTQEEKINVVLIKRIMTEKKTALPSLGNQDRKKVKIETENVSKLLPTIPIYNITKLNKLIYAGVK